MNAIEFVRHGLESSYGWTAGLLRDMQDSPLTFPTSNGGNHPLWVLGHLVFSESTLFDQCILGGENRYLEWRELFGVGTTAVANVDQYPSMADLFDHWEQLRAEVLAYLDTLNEQDFDRESHAPEEMGPMFGTVGGCFNAMIGHPQFHGGQVSDARRAAGKTPLFG